MEITTLHQNIATNASLCSQAACSLLCSAYPLALPSSEPRTARPRRLGSFSQTCTWLSSPPSLQGILLFSPYQRSLCTMLIWPNSAIGHCFRFPPRTSHNLVAQGIIGFNFCPPPPRLASWTGYMGCPHCWPSLEHPCDCMHPRYSDRHRWPLAPESL
jgi:hypothetical protein